MIHIRKGIVCLLQVLVVGLLLGISVFGQDSASKAAASEDTSITVYGGVNSSGASGWQTLSSVDIKPAGGKDLLITVSMQSGLFNASIVPVTPQFFLQFSGLRVRVVVDGDVVNLASPGPVTWDRQLNLILGLPTPGLDLNLLSGVRSFTFVKRNVGVGVHHIEVQGNFQFAAFDSEVLAGSWAFVSNRSLTVEQVSLKQLMIGTLYRL